MWVLVEKEVPVQARRGDEAEAILLLCSLKAIIKESSVVAVILGRPTPNPRIGASVELSGSDARGLLNLISVGKTLPGQGITAEEPPPSFLQIQPTGSCGNEDVMEPGMLGHPGARLGTIVAGKVVSDDEDLARRIFGFDVRQEGDVVGRVA